jgi:hypothetical protein
VLPRSETGDARVLPILQALTAFFEGQDVVTAGYTLEGKHLANFSHLSFTAPVCCLFKVGRHSICQTGVEKTLHEQHKTYLAAYAGVQITRMTAVPCLV